MAILCEQQNITISETNSLICDILVRISNIRSNESTIDVQIDNTFTNSGVSTEGNSFEYNENWITVKLISKDVLEGTAIINFTISDLPPLEATHYIQYDLSDLPQEFLDLITSNITIINHKFGEYIPTLSDNIVYIDSTFLNKKFRINFNYTPPSQTLHVNTSYNGYFNNEYSNNINSLEELSDLSNVAISISGILLFIIGAIIVLFGGWIAILAGATIAAFGTVITQYSIGNLLSGDEESHSTNITPSQSVENIEDFIDNVLDPSAEDLTQECNCPTVQTTCTVDNMIFYVGGRGTARLAQCIHLNRIKPFATEYCTDVIKTEILAIRDGLSNGSLTPQQACDRLETNIVVPVKKEVTDTKSLIKCQGQIWSISEQRCVDIEPCWIKSPLTEECILTARAGKTILFIGGTLGLIYLYSKYKK